MIEMAVIYIWLVLIPALGIGYIGVSIGDKKGDENYEGSYY